MIFATDHIGFIAHQAIKILPHLLGIQHGIQARTRLHIRHQFAHHKRLHGRHLLLRQLVALIRPRFDSLKALVLAQQRLGKIRQHLHRVFALLLPFQHHLLPIRLAARCFQQFVHAFGGICR